MTDGSLAVALLNRGTETAVMFVDPNLNAKWSKFRVRDLWLREMGDFTLTEPYVVEVMSHEAKILRVWPLG